MTERENIIKTGDFEVLDSRIIQILENEKTIIHLGGISLSFRFQKVEVGEPAIKAVIEGNELGFILENITQPSYGTTDFIQFSETTDGKKMYISFRIHSLNDKRVRSLEYTIYQKNV